ncbi:MAG: hypothetical protein JNM69_18620, partial [Archangium sp.]|nr:hypothetical protein [Archangium sp.]
GVTSLLTGAGLTGGPITATGTIALADAGVETRHLADRSVTFSKLAPNGCTTNQVPQFDGTSWGCAAIAGGAPDNGCPGALFGSTCLLSWDNTQSTNFQTAAQTCANLGGDICTDSQMWPIAVGNWQNQYLVTTILNSPHWSASFADDDGNAWPGATGSVGDDHSANSSYGYPCCGGARPPNARVPVRVSASGVRYTAIHDINDTNFAGAVGYCAALGSDLCSDSQNFVLRFDGLLASKTWSNSHSDNDATLYNAINGGTDDNPSPASRYGFACCPSQRPLSLTCPVPRTAGVCALSVNNVTNATFSVAARACAGQGADLCSMSQSAVLRVAGVLTAARVWTNSHSDNDSANASVAVGSSMPDNPNLTDPGAYACCLN